MAVSRNRRMFNHMANDFAARHVGFQIPLPLAQQLSRYVIVTRGQGVTDARKMVAKAPEPQGGVKHHQTPQHGQEPTAKPPQQPMHQHGQCAREHHGQSPRDPGMPLVASVQGVTQPVGPLDEQLVDARTGRARAGLFQQQGKQEGNETHGPMIVMPTQWRSRLKFGL